MLSLGWPAIPISRLTAVSPALGQAHFLYLEPWNFLISLLSSVFLKAEEKNKPQIPCDSRNLNPMPEAVVVSPWSGSDFAVPFAPAQEKLCIPSPLTCRRGSSEVRTGDVFLCQSVWGPLALSGWQTLDPVHPPSLRLYFRSPTGLLFWSALPIWTDGS